MVDEQTTRSYKYIIATNSFMGVFTVFNMEENCLMLYLLHRIVKKM